MDPRRVRRSYRELNLIIALARESGTSLRIPKRVETLFKNLRSRPGSTFTWSYWRMQLT